jgi:hypothetical protein
MTDGNVIEGLGTAIRDGLGCDSRWLHSVQVFVAHGGKSWWGTVEVFLLLGHGTAERAYAWHGHDGTGDRVVLHAPPIDGPLEAIRAVAFK